METCTDHVHTYFPYGLLFPFTIHTSPLCSDHLNKNKYHLCYFIISNILLAILPMEISNCLRPCMYDESWEYMTCSMINSLLIKDCVEVMINHSCLKWISSAIFTNNLIYISHIMVTVI